MHPHSESDITTYARGDRWIAKRKGTPDEWPRGRGPSSVEAHGNLLEREAEHVLATKEKS